MDGLLACIDIFFPASPLFQFRLQMLSHRLVCCDPEVKSRVEQAAEVGDGIGRILVYLLNASDFKSLNISFGPLHSPFSFLLKIFRCQRNSKAYRFLAVNLFAFRYQITINWIDKASLLRVMEKNMTEI